MTHGVGCGCDLHDPQLGAGAVAIGLLLPDMWGYAVLGGILIVVGILLLVAFRRAGGPLSGNL